MTGIFISYRRSDSQAMTGRIYDRLAETFGEDQIFQDVESIPAGENIKTYIQDVVSSCQVLLVVIGAEWLTTTDPDGRRRIDKPDDWVAIEVEAGLRNEGVLVVPLLVDGARLPTAGELPPDLRELHLRNALPIRYNPDFNSDMDRLIEELVEARPKLAAAMRRQQRRIPRGLLAGAALLAVLLIVGVTQTDRIGDWLGQLAPAPTEITTQSTPTQMLPTATSTSPPTLETTDEIAIDDDQRTIESLIIRSTESSIDVFVNPTGNEVLTRLLPGMMVSYDADSLTDGMLNVETADGWGWVNADAIGFVCPVADGFDAPVGTAEERRAAELWPGEWTNFNGFANTYSMGGRQTIHTGVDLNLPDEEGIGAPVYSIASGTVYLANLLPSWGKVIVIKHDPVGSCDGPVIYARYAHLGEMSVVVGNRVERGQQIGTVGNAEGRNPTYHLHFDMSYSSNLGTKPTLWPGDDLNGLRENFLDPEIFISANRPPS